MTEADDPKAGKRRSGRPRAAGGVPERPVREEILDAARALFRQQGYSATSTRQIAARAGLRQPTLFHYFPAKEHILNEIALGAVRPVLEFVAAEAPRRDPGDVALYRLVRFDTWHLCTNPNALGSPFLLPEMSRDRLPGFWAARDRLLGHYRRLLRRGATQGTLRVENVALVTRLLFALGESALEVEAERRRRQARRLATVTANLALRAVLTEPERLQSVRGAADRP